MPLDDEPLISLVTQDSPLLLNGVILPLKYEYKSCHPRREKMLIFTHKDNMVFILFLRDAVEKLHSMDDAFKKQVDAIVEAHHAEIIQLASEKQKYIDSANLKVLYK